MERSQFVLAVKRSSVRFRYAPHKGLRVVNDQEMIKFAALFSFVHTIVPAKALVKERDTLSTSNLSQTTGIRGKGKGTG